MSRTRAAGSQSDRRHHRQPEREKRGKRGACIDPHGYDAGKKIKGKKRHILVDTVGLLLHAIVHPADIQDRDGGVLVMATLFGMFPFLKTLFADSGYQGPKFAKALAKVLPHLDIEIVKRSDQVSGFVVLPKRWIVERTIAWLNRCRRLAKDWENLIPLPYQSDLTIYGKDVMDFTFWDCARCRGSPLRAWCARRPWI